jgi:hypothetical protein
MLDVAAEFGDLELCKYLIHAQGADPSARSVITPFTFSAILS